MPSPDLPRVLLVGNYAPDRQQSMLRFAEVMERGLRERGVPVTLVQPELRWLGTRDSRGGLGKWLGYGDKFLRFPNHLRVLARDHDVVHVLDHSNSAYCHTLRDRPHVLTCHDLLAVRSAHGEFAQNPTRWSGRRLQAMILTGVRAARMVACVSRATMADVERLAGLSGERLALVPNGLNHPYGPLPTEQVLSVLGGLGIPATGRYLLHVGGNHWYKNRGGALRIAAALRRLPGFEDLRVVMVGEPFDDSMRAIVAQHDLAPCLHEVTQADNTQLNALYCGALALIFPSLHEGFGWPVIEAQACGCPAFVSDRAPLPEIVGDAAVTFPPEQPEVAAQVIAAGLSKRALLSEAALGNAARFTTAAMIDGYLALYRRVSA